jgi:hypothetical protein
MVSQAKEGDSWLKENVPRGQGGDVIAISSNGWTAVVGQATILISPSGRRSWKVLDGGKGGFRSTIDGGTTFRDVDQLGRPLPTSLSRKELCPAESAVLTTSGRLYVKTVCEHTTQLWSIPTRSQSEAWNVVSFTYERDPSNGIYSAGHNLTLIGERVLIDTNLPTGPALLTTDDNGGTWYPWWHGAAEDAGIVGLSFIDEQTGWMLQGNGRLLKTVNGGRRWDSLTQLPSEFAGKFTALEFADSQTGFIVGLNGLAFVARDGGRSWEQKNVSTTADLYKLAAADAKRVWAVGNKGTLMETVDGGEHWQRVALGVDKDIRFGLTVKDGIAWLISDGALFRSS